ncbi:GGDEF domain-containing protein [Psychromonas sp. MME2]|uniref:GGDEF domain-containing protein n=1 Tax=unclassified Psychromonas TaxID=2614957 RepID=UPI00339CF3A1
MSDDLIVESVKNLKKAVPLMMKYKVPTTPINYALWYNYVAKDIPQLNVELDAILTQQAHCSEIQTEVLYRQFVADESESSTWQLRQNVEKMLLQLDQSITDTHSDTVKFRDSFDKTFSQVSMTEDKKWSVDEVISLLKKIEGDSEEMSRSTQFFSESLQAAKAEISTLKEELQKSQQQALYDALTGLLNRHSFDVEVTNFINNEANGLCLIIADIDNFKLLNDQWGHLLGDQVLKAVAKKLSSSMREGAKVYRFGGEEFIILLPKSNLRVARHFAETLRKLMEKVALKDKRTGKWINNITLSFGVVECQERDSVSSLIARADEYLYEAKRLGRNRVLPMMQ